MTNAMSAVKTPPCKCSVAHRPAVLEPQSHHLWPVYLGGPEIKATMIGLCPTTHTNVHRILRAMVKAGRILTRTELKESGRPAVPYYSWVVACNGFNAWDIADRPLTVQLKAQWEADKQTEETD